MPEVPSNTYSESAPGHFPEDVFPAYLNDSSIPYIQPVLVEMSANSIRILPYLELRAPVPTSPSHLVTSKRRSRCTWEI